MNADIFALLFKVSVILALAAVAVTVLRNSSAARRHFVWFGAMASIIVLVVLQLFVPTIVVQIAEQSPLAVIAHSAGDALPSNSLASSPASTEQRPGASDFSAATINLSTRNSHAAESRGAIATSRANTGSISQDASRIPATAVEFDVEFTQQNWLTNISPETIRQSLLALWLTGSLLLLLRFANAHLQLRRVAQSSQRILDRELCDEVARLARSLGIAKSVTLLVHENIDTPCTAGWRHPIILLPSNRTDWSDRRRRAVIMHELAHISRSDSVAQTVASIACALFWFHPGFWMAARMLRAEGERAADDCVINGGMSPFEYADHLLAIANTSTTLTRSPAAALGMARSSQLETRMRAMLNAGQSRSTITRGVQRTFGTVVLLLVIPFAGLQARVQEIPAKPQPPVATPSKVQPPVKTSPTTPPKVIPSGVEKPGAIGAAPAKEPQMVIDPASGAKLSTAAKHLEQSDVQRAAKPSADARWIEKQSGVAPPKAQQPALPKKMPPPPPPARDGEARAAVPSKKMAPPPPAKENIGAAVPSKKMSPPPPPPLKDDGRALSPKKTQSPPSDDVIGNERPSSDTPIKKQRPKTWSVVWATPMKEQAPASVKEFGVPIIKPQFAQSSRKLSPSEFASADTILERTVEVIPGDSLLIHIPAGGNVIVNGWDSPTAKLRAKIGGKNWRETQVVFRGVKKGLNLVAVSGIDGSVALDQYDGYIVARPMESLRYVPTTIDNEFELWVPRHTKIKFVSPIGGLILRDMDQGAYAVGEPSSVDLTNFRKLVNPETGNIVAPIKASTLIDLARSSCGQINVYGAVTRTGDGDIITGTVKMSPSNTGLTAVTDSATARLRNKSPLIIVDGVIQAPSCK